MNFRNSLCQILLCLMLALCAEAQVPDSVRLTGTWTGREQGGSEADELTFSQGNKVVISSMGYTIEGQYEIDSSKSPNLLVFHLGPAPGQKMCASIEMKSDREIYLSHLCDGTPEALAKQPIVTFVRK